MLNVVKGPDLEKVLRARAGAGLGDEGKSVVAHEFFDPRTVVDEHCGGMIQPGALQKAEGFPFAQTDLQRLWRAGDHLGAELLPQAPGILRQQLQFADRAGQDQTGPFRGADALHRAEIGVGLGGVRSQVGLVHPPQPCR